MSENGAKGVVGNLETDIAQRDHGRGAFRFDVNFCDVRNREAAHLFSYPDIARDHGSKRRISMRKLASMMRPMMPMVSIPTMMISVRNMLRASLMRKPSPEFAPTSSAATKAIHPDAKPDSDTRHDLGERRLEDHTGQNLWLGR